MIVENDNCPVCKSSNIQGDGVDIQGQYAYQECSCNDCGTEWQDEYIFNKNVILKTGEVK